MLVLMLQHDQYSAKMLLIILPESVIYREIPLGELNSNNRNLKFIENKKSFDPERVYKGIPNPTKI